MFKLRFKLMFKLMLNMFSHLFSLFIHRQDLFRIAPSAGKRRSQNFLITGTRMKARSIRSKYRKKAVHISHKTHWRPFPSCPKYKTKVLNFPSAGNRVRLFVNWPMYAKKGSPEFLTKTRRTQPGAPFELPSEYRKNEWRGTVER